MRKLMMTVMAWGLAATGVAGDFGLNSLGVSDVRASQKNPPVPAAAPQEAKIAAPLPLADDPGYPAARGWFQNDERGRAFAAADPKIRRIAHDPGVPSAADKAWLVAQCLRLRSTR